MNDGPRTECARYRENLYNDVFKEDGCRVYVCSVDREGTLPWLKWVSRVETLERGLSDGGWRFVVGTPFSAARQTMKSAGKIVASEFDSEHAFAEQWALPSFSSHLRTPCHHKRCDILFSRSTQQHILVDRHTRILHIMDESIETTLLVIRECFVYKIPIRGATGFKAADWDLPNPLWTGRLTVKSKGQQAFVKLEDSSTGEIFAVCPVYEAAVEPVNDSSRYYVLKIEDGQKRHAFIGLGFSERSEAFDFSAALQDHARFIKQEKDAEKAVANLSSQPAVDYSLKQGEKITINMANAPTRTRPAAPAGGNSSGFSGLLPPPPGSKNKVTSPVQSHAAPQHQQPAADPFGFSQPQQQPQQSFNSSPFDFGAPQQQQFNVQQQQQQFNVQQQQQYNVQQPFGFNNAAQQQQIPVQNDPFAGLAGFGVQQQPQQQRPAQNSNNNPFDFF
ncbi:hypothetical protein PROFUN_02857 [Planoprotostelium fungivorum]|uniref:NECAP PHear domain-containing protein n=1 Tax=Planoprotostelium fungivorum TaxID=1890364 RepID=A0A2P6NS64_9EUKA|nr:hypothetical protein PROFUN_02857 [Planoprotostelium fungivorum]